MSSYTWAGSPCLGTWLVSSGMISPDRVFSLMVKRYPVTKIIMINTKMLGTISTTTNDTATAVISPFISVIDPELNKPSYTIELNIHAGQ